MTNQLRLFTIIAILSMGCPPSHEAHPHHFDTEFIVLVRRLAVEFEMQAGRMVQQAKRLKSALKFQLNKPLEGRSYQSEESLLSEITLICHKKAIYDYLAVQCRSILDRQRFVPVLLKSSILDREQSQAKLSMRIPIEVLIFSISIVCDERDSVKNADLAKFSRLVSTKFKDIREPQTVEHELLNYYKQLTVPSRQMLRETVFQLCLELQIPLERFRETGHNYQF